jgi:hypothetical protein
MKTLISTAIVLIFSVSLMAQTSSNLKLNLEKGKVYKLKNSNRQNIQQSANGQQFNSDVYSGTFMSYKMLKQEKDILFIEFKFDTIESKINSPMFKRETNSAKPAKSKEYLERMMNKLSTHKLIAKISTAGKFVGFTNYQSFKDSVMMVMDSVPDTKRDQVQKQADGVLKESVLQSMIEPFFAYLPDKAVNTGDKWETSLVQTSAMASILTFNSYTLNSIEHNTAKISGTSEIESMPSSDPSSQMSTEIKGTSTSDLTVDVSTGLLLKSSIKGHVEGTMTIKNQGNEMKMPMVVDSQSEITKVE